jgi:hypothetical protein
MTRVFRLLRRGAPAIAACSWSFALAASAWAETKHVRRGDDLQAVLDAAAPGDEILLEAGAEFAGNFVLPVKAGEAPIVLGSAPSSGLPSEGERIRPAHAPLLARIRSPNSVPALKTAPAAHHWELRYLEFAANRNGYGDVIQIGDGSKAQDTIARVPHHIVISHVYIHGDPQFGQKRGIALNAAHVTIRDSHIDGIKAVGQDTQAIGGWNGPGPYVIENNYLEAAGENVMFGGADPAIPGLVPDGITVRRNYFSRPLAWREPILSTPQGLAAVPAAGGGLPAGTYSYRVEARGSVGQGTIGRSTVSAEVSAAVPADNGAVRVTWAPVDGATEYRVYARRADGAELFWIVTTTVFEDTGAAGASGAAPAAAGTVWSVKNIFELKNARNVAVEENVFEHHWKESQAGYAIVLTPRNSQGACTWCVVEHVRFERNVVRRVAAAINILGYDIPSRPTRQSSDIVFRHNLFYEIGGAAYGGVGRFLQIGDEAREVIFDHNTISHEGSSLVFAYGGTSTDPRQMHGVRFTNNAGRHGAYGIAGAFFAYGNGIIEGFFPDGVVTGNFLASGPSSRYPDGNLTSGAFETEFVDVAAADFQLRAGSQLRGAATDGSDIGVDIGTLAASLKGVEEGVPAAPPLQAPANVRLLTTH